MPGRKGALGQEMRHIGATNPRDVTYRSHWPKEAKRHLVGPNLGSSSGRDEWEWDTLDLMPGPAYQAQPTTLDHWQSPCMCSSYSSSRTVPKGCRSAHDGVKSEAHQPVGPSFCWDSIREQSPLALNSYGAQSGPLPLSMVLLLAQLPLQECGAVLARKSSPWA